MRLAQEKSQPAFSPPLHAVSHSFQIWPRRGSVAGIVFASASSFGSRMRMPSLPSMAMSIFAFVPTYITPSFGSGAPASSFGAGGLIRPSHQVKRSSGKFPRFG